VAERISVIVATYNRPDALDAVLRSLVRQNDADFEVLVADDGSTQPTKELIDAWQKRFNGRLRHVWHADDGFRLAEIRNRAPLRLAPIASRIGSDGSAQMVFHLLPHAS